MTVTLLEIINEIASVSRVVVKSAKLAGRFARHCPGIGESRADFERTNGRQPPFDPMRSRTLESRGR
jgi:hypothetical protein